MRLRFPLVAVFLLSVVACTTPRPPLPADGSFQPPPEANFNERADVIPLTPGKFTHKGLPLKAPELVSDGFTRSLAPDSRRGYSDMYLYFVVEKDGSVKQVKTVISSGQSSLDDSIQQYIGTWHYRPATLGGEPVAVSMGFIYRVNVVEGH